MTAVQSGNCGNNLDHRVDEEVGPLLLPDAAEAANGEAAWQTGRRKIVLAGTGRMEEIEVDAVHHHLMRHVEIGARTCAGGDHRVHPADQPFGEGLMAACWRRRSEKQVDRRAEHPFQHKPGHHLGVAPRMPECVAARTPAGGAGMSSCHQRIFRKAVRQAGPDRQQYRSCAPAQARVEMIVLVTPESLNFRLGATTSTLDMSSTSGREAFRSE